MPAAGWAFAACSPVAWQNAHEPNTIYPKPSPRPNVLVPVAMPEPASELGDESVAPDPTVPLPPGSPRVIEIDEHWHDAYLDGEEISDDEQGNFAEREHPGGTRPKNVSTVILSGSGSALGKTVHTTKLTISDASGTSSASGAGSGNATSVDDTSSVTCAFTTDSSTVNSSTTGIQIVTGASPSSSSCTNKNACILCTTAASGSSCSIACSGTVPSNTATGNDSFNVYATYTASLTTNMASTGGMIRVDGKLTNWSEFAFNGQAHSPTNTTVATSYAGCNGTSSSLEAYSGSGTLGDALSIASSTATAFTHDPAIIAVGNGTCTLSYQFKAAMPLTGANVPGTAVNLTRGSFSFGATICDVINSATCVAPF